MRRFQMRAQLPAGAGEARANRSGCNAQLFGCGFITEPLNANHVQDFPMLGGHPQFIKTVRGAGYMMDVN